MPSTKHWGQTHHTDNSLNGGSLLNLQFKTCACLKGTCLSIYFLLVIHSQVRVVAGLAWYFRHFLPRPDKLCNPSSELWVCPEILPSWACLILSLWGIRRGERPEPIIQYVKPGFPSHLTKTLEQPVTSICTLWWVLLWTHSSLPTSLAL